MDLTLGQIAEIVDGEVVGDPEIRVRHIATDSRAAFALDTLFVALKGPRFDGHNYLDAAFASGARAALVSGEDDRPGVRVADTLVALQALAKHHREQFGGLVVGITGSNGKTIVKEMLSAILARSFEVYRSPGSYNSQVGVAISLLGMKPHHRFAVIEAGISHPGEMDTLAQMIQPDVGVLTTLGTAHREGLLSLENTAHEKLKLFANTKTIIATKDASPYLDEAIFVDVDGDDPFCAKGVKDNPHGFSFDVVGPDQGFEATLNVPGRHNIHNALCAAAVAMELGIEVEDIQDGLASFELAPMRLEMHTTSAGVTLINDAYSSDPVSAKAALGTLQFYAGGHPTIAVLGDMHDLGEDSEALHQELGAAVQQLGIHRLIAYGDWAETVQAAAIAEGMAKENAQAITEFDELSEQLDATVQPGDFVLFKGSRPLGLERAAEQLLESVAPTRLFIDLDAIRANVRAIRATLGDDTRLMAVVKSFAYGNDSTRVSQTLVREGIDALAVAYPDEAIPLRKRGLQIPILVTNVLAEEADKIVKYDLTPLVYSRQVVAALSEWGVRADKTVEAHIEVDTGMNRVGVKPQNVLEFAKFVSAADNVNLAGIMTHFASADDPQADQFTHEQIMRFDVVLESLRAEGLDPGLVHAANTAAAWRFPEARYDMVRIGLGLYGYHPSYATSEIADTVAALRFETRVIHVKTVTEGDTVSYGRTWAAQGERRIATIAAGYNDGFSRFMSNGGHVLIRGQRCSVVGTVCMDVSMVDVTHLPEVEVGDAVVLFGKQGKNEITVNEIADRGRTINYEVLCKIAPRVRRIFTREI